MACGLYICGHYDNKSQMSSQADISQTFCKIQPESGHVSSLATSGLPNGLLVVAQHLHC